MAKLHQETYCYLLQELHGQLHASSAAPEADAASAVLADAHQQAATDACGILPLKTFSHVMQPANVSMRPAVSAR